MNNTTSFTLKFACILLFMALSLPSYGKSVRYVSDSLTIPMRSGTTNRHKILKFLPSGSQLKILETSKDGSYSRVLTDEGKEGWVDNNQLMDKPSARDQLAINNKRLAGLADKNHNLKSTITDLNKQLSQLKQQNQQFDENNQDLKTQLRQLKISAAEPLAIAKKNQDLQLQIQQISDKNQALIQDNARLNDQSTKHWFMIGAAVALGSLFLGLIIPSIKWRKKDSWGGSF